MLYDERGVGYQHLKQSLLAEDNGEIKDEFQRSDTGGKPGKYIRIKATDTVANKRLEVSESDLEVQGSGMPSLDMEIFL